MLICESMCYTRTDTVLPKAVWPPKQLGLLQASPFGRGYGPCPACHERTPNALASVMPNVPEPLINNISTEVEHFEHKIADLTVSRVLDNTL